MSVTADAAARAAAIDPVNSFCVTAPAGSGKTELLIQRYLCLLSRVSRPEQVLAITFTRKAAAEMRERVLQALHAAAAGEHCDSPHQQATRALAHQALAADERGTWHLLRDISRFNIKTIDSFCAGLTRQMPVLSQLGGQADVLDDTSAMYAEAVIELYALIEDAHPVATDVAALMLHFDNNWDRLQALLIGMLARREQWRDYVGVHHAPEEAEAHLVAAVSSLIEDELGELKHLLKPYQSQLLELLQFSAANLRSPVPPGFPSDSADDLSHWHGVYRLLLTGGGQWRKTITKNEGFPADKGKAQEQKARWKALISELREIDGLHARLTSMLSLPLLSADSASWQLVLHLSRILPVLAAQLLLVFRKYGVVDHSQIAQSALFALGEDDTPTELALRLDYQIEHILVDEFQDTAVTQYELLHKLTRGWGEHNTANPVTPRTLMIVGDGMQSIYGFRGANVGLFLKARREGFNGVSLQHLELSCNFRSDAGIVEWVNATFQSAFPAQDDVLRSQVRFSAATAVRPMTTTNAVELHAFSGESARTGEIAFICKHIGACLKESTQTIAVLGRSRSHLQAIIAQLKLRGIAYNAPELETLSRSSTVADLLTLCRALSNDADRLAWMAVLRAPWCGLQLVDLLRIASVGDAPADTPIWSALENTQLQQELTLDGRNRLLHILTALHFARTKRDRLSLRVWIEQVWTRLGGPACVLHADQLHDAETFLQLLEIAETEGVGLDMDWLTTRLQKYYVAAGDPDSRVQLLTLHKAKGLEFDRVILPQLDRLPRSDARDILLWDEHSSSRGERFFLLAADDHSTPDSPTLYNYLRAQRQQKTVLESTRLLYVGATRAVHNLLLTACVHTDARTGQLRDPAKPTLLHRIWPVFMQQMTLHNSESSVQQTAGVTDRRAAPLLRLERTTPAQATVLQPPATAAATLPVAAFHHRIERAIGTVVHLALEELSKRAALPEALSQQDEDRWRSGLQRQGIWGRPLEDALQRVILSVTACLQKGSRGRWVLSPRHQDAHSEWALTTADDQGRIQDIVIDRSFIDATTGERWIIDYKNAQPAAEERLEDFFTRQSMLYHEQLQRYRNAVQGLDSAPLRCGLFFTALGLLHPVPLLNLPASESPI